MSGSGEFVNGHPAYVQVWGKGFRVSADSEEFQIFVPQEFKISDFHLEQYLWERDWGSILEPLYGLGGTELAAERCLLVRQSEFMSISFAPTEDRHHRPSLVLVAATARISWDDVRLGELAARCHALSSRLADAYATAFKSNPANVGHQLRESLFLPDRMFNLDAEHIIHDNQWNPVVSAIKAWNGVFGIATPRLLSLGANVVLGTRHEAAMLQPIADGYFDSRDLEIYALSERMTRWHTVALIAPNIPADTTDQKDDISSSTDTVLQVGPPVDTQVGTQTSPSASPVDTRQEQIATSRQIESIANSLHGINQSIARISEAFVNLCGHIVRFWLPDKQDGDKKKSKR